MSWVKSVSSIIKLELQFLLQVANEGKTQNTWFANRFFYNLDARR
jgi:hypothetical protein